MLKGQRAKANVAIGKSRESFTQNDWEPSL